MLEFSSGNILQADVEALVNTVNCVGVMGKGIALQFKQAYPDNFKQYYKICKDNKLVPGRVFVYDRGSLWNPRFIINFPTKRHWKGKSRIEDIESGLVSLISEVKKLNIKSIAIPPLGCGSGGLEWDDVKPLIENTFSGLPFIHVLVYEPKGSPKPADMPITTPKPKMTRARAMIIRLIDLYRIPEYKLTLLEIQKLAYFLQCAGEPLRLRFVAHKYGPYANNLNHLLERIEGHYIRGFGDRSSGAEITLMPGAIKKSNEYIASKSGEEQRILDRIKALIEGFETPYGLELLSSIHWVAMKNDPDLQKDPDQTINVIHAWNERKRQVLKPDHIRIGWQRLKEHGWFDISCC